MISLIYKLLPGRVKRKLLHEVRLEALKGSNVFCPCCNKGYITFLPYGLKRRLNALCPGCHSLERHRLMWLYFQTRTNIFDDQIKFLHIAPERMFFKKFKNSLNIEYIAGAKMDPGFPDEYPDGTLNLDVTSLPFRDEHFDAIYCSHVLEHVPDDKKAMAEFFRVLKRGGWAILQVPLEKTRNQTYEDWSIIDPGEREQAFGQKDHVRIYGTDYRDRLIEAGFTVTCDDYVAALTSEDRFKYGLMIEEDVYFCTK